MVFAPPLRSLAAFTLLCGIANAQWIVCEGVSGGISFDLTQHFVTTGPYVLNGSVPAGWRLWWCTGIGGAWIFSPNFHRSGWHGLTVPWSSCEASLIHTIDNGPDGDDLVVEIEILARPSTWWDPSGSYGLMDIQTQVDLLINVASNSTVTCGVQLEGSITTGPYGSEVGNAWLNIDVDDDGTDEASTACGFWCTQTAPGADVVELSMAPRPIRIRGSVSVSYSAATIGSGHVTLRLSPKLAGMRPLGTACGGSSWTPELRTPPGEVPRLGDNLHYSVEGLPVAPTPLAILIGIDGDTASGLPLPIDLSPMGMPGCSQYLDPLLPLTQLLLSQGGIGAAQVSLPTDVMFLGFEFFLQGLVAAPGVNAAGLLSTNGLRGYIGS